MRGIQFYEEYIDGKKPRISTKNCIAVFLDHGLFYINKVESLDALAAIPQENMQILPDSPVYPIVVARAYLHSNCAVVSEHKARSIHPMLFKALDPLPVLPHGLTVSERIVWLREHKPYGIKWLTWFKGELHNEYVTRGLEPLEYRDIAFTHHGVPYTGFDEKRGIPDTPNAKDEF